MFETSLDTNFSFYHNGDFVDPFYDMSTLKMPRNMQDALQWAESIWMRNGVYREACRRVTNFFLTSIEYSDISDDEKGHWEDFDNNKSKLFDVLGSISADWHCYNNSFTSVFTPFIRYLGCPRCNTQRPACAVEYEFRKGEFIDQRGCNSNNGNRICGYKGPLKRVDRPLLNPEKIKIIRWSPHLIKIKYNPISHDVCYTLRIPGEIRTAILKGDPFFIETLPWEFVKTVLEEKDFQFNDGALFHLKQETLAGIRNAGWGLPSILTILPQIYHIQVLERYDEAIALDYIMPLRIITPAGGNSSVADPLKSSNMGNLVSRIEWMLRERRRDPAMWNILPFPIEYKAFGGEAKTIFTADIKTLAMDSLLNAMGVPPEFYKMNLGIQTAPTSVRLFQQMHAPFISGINSWLDWSTEKIASYMSWDKPGKKLKPPTLADDLELRQIMLQLAASDRISMGTAVGPMGIDMEHEQERLRDEKRRNMEEQQKFQKDIKNQQLQDLVSMPSSGGPEGEGGGGNVTPGDLQGQAEDLAQQTVRMPSLAQKRKLLAQIRGSSETLYSLVKKRMEDARSAAGAQGREGLVNAPQA